MISWINNRLKKNKKVIFLFLATISSLCYVSCGYAEVETITPTQLASNVADTTKQISTVISDVALIAGISFILSALFKFHQHKTNPQQVTMSQAVTLLVVGAGLCLFPTMLPTSTQAAFGVGADSINDISGAQIHEVIGAGT